jgi:hypothetical protein
MLGKTLSQLHSPLAEKAKYYRKNSQALIASTQQYSRRIAKININNEVILFDMRTSKIFDDSDGELVGLATFFYKLSPNIEILKLLSVGGDEIFLDYGNEPAIFATDQIFNYRERCIIWLLAIGKTRKEVASSIAAIENHPLTENTITTIINRNIYPVLGVNNHSAFMDAIVKNNLLSSIPLDLLSYFSQY